MGSEFERRFGRTNRNRTTSRPECYGDEDEYDSQDAECRACPVRGTCRSVVMRKLQQHQDSSFRSRSHVRSERRTSTSSTKRDTRVSRRENHTIVEHPPNITFWHALGHNTVLNVAQAILNTISHAAESIDRFTYPSPFSYWEDDD